jgi:hypothetical protein
MDVDNYQVDTAFGNGVDKDNMAKFFFRGNQLAAC